MQRVVVPKSSKSVKERASALNSFFSRDAAPVASSSKASQAIGGYATAAVAPSRATREQEPAVSETQHQVIDVTQNAHIDHSADSTSGDPVINEASDTVSDHSNRIAQSIAEFYSVQRKFHAEISKLIPMLGKLVEMVPEDKRLYYLDLLEPYYSLSKNPFTANPTGDLETDLQHIFKVTNEKNALFKQVLGALHLSISNSASIRSELNKLQDDEHFAAEIKRLIPSRMKLAGAVDGPLWHLIRYELLLSMIKKNLVDAGYQPTDEALSVVTKSLESIVPEVRHVDRCKDVIDSLNCAERVIFTLMSQEGMKVADGYLISNHAMAAHNMLLGVYGALRNHKNYILSGGDDIIELLDGTLAVLEEVVRLYKERQNSWPKYISSLATSLTFFTSAQHDNSDPFEKPLTELNNVITEMRLLKQAREISPLFDEGRAADVYTKAKTDYAGTPDAAAAESGLSRRI